MEKPEPNSGVPSGADRLIGYLEEALQSNLPVAPFDLVNDSQSRWALKKISGLPGKIQILDYGCGNLRLLNALSKSQVLDRISYVATDIVQPQMLEGSPPYEFLDAESVQKLKTGSFDAIVMMNIIHELPLRDFARAIETSRRLLKPTGFLYVIDMAILPEGEFRSLPYYPWELSKFFLTSVDESYSSKSGVPVVALSIPKEGIPVFPQFLDRLCSTVLVKRDTYCDLAAMLHARKDEVAIERVLTSLSLNKGTVHDLGYLILMSGMANLRIIEHQRSSGQTPYEQITNATEAIIELFVATFNATGKHIEVADILSQLGATHSYEAISTALSIITAGAGTFFLPLYMENLGSNKLAATLSLEIFEDHFEYKDMSEMGLGTLQAECYRILYGEELQKPIDPNFYPWRRWL